MPLADLSGRVHKNERNENLLLTVSTMFFIAVYMYMECDKQNVNNGGVIYHKVLVNEQHDLI